MSHLFEGWKGTKGEGFFFILGHPPQPFPLPSQQCGPARGTGHPPPVSLGSLQRVLVFPSTAEWIFLHSVRCYVSPSDPL